MILKAYMEICDPYVTSFRHSIQDADGKELAVGTNQEEKSHLVMEISGKRYHFLRKIIKLEKSSYSFPYPLASARNKTLGYEVVSDSGTVIRTYQEAATDRKTWLFKRNFLFNVYQYRNESYLCFKVGFADSPSHFYFLKTIHGETIAAIERHMISDDDRRATIYLKDEAFLELVYLVCGFEIMFVSHRAADVTDVVDSSAGNYISVTEGEKAMYDKNFIPAVKAMHGIYN